MTIEVRQIREEDIEDSEPPSMRWLASTISGAARRRHPWERASTFVRRNIEKGYPDSSP